MSQKKLSVSLNASTWKKAEFLMQYWGLESIDDAINHLILMSTTPVLASTHPIESPTLPNREQVPSVPMSTVVNELQSEPNGVAVGTVPTSTPEKTPPNAANAFKALKNQK